MSALNEAHIPSDCFVEDVPYAKSGETSLHYVKVTRAIGRKIGIVLMREGKAFFLPGPEMSPLAVLLKLEGDLYR